MAPCFADTGIIFVGTRVPSSATTGETAGLSGEARRLGGTLARRPVAAWAVDPKRESATGPDHYARAWTRSRGALRLFELGIQSYWVLASLSFWPRSRVKADSQAFLHPVARPLTLLL